MLYTCALFSREWSRHLCVRGLQMCPTPLSHSRVYLLRTITAVNEGRRLKSQVVNHDPFRFGTGCSVCGRSYLPSCSTYMSTLWRDRTAAKCLPALLLGLALTTSTPLVDSNPANGLFGTAPVFAQDDTSAGMSSVGDSKLSYGAASTGDKGRHVGVDAQLYRIGPYYACW